MKKIVLLVIFSLLFGCGVGVDKYLGTWNYGAPLSFRIYKSGDAIVVEEFIKESGVLIRRQEAKLVDGALVFEQGMFNKFIYNPDRDTITPIGHMVAPELKRM